MVFKTFKTYLMPVALGNGIRVRPRPSVFQAAQSNAEGQTNKSINAAVVVVVAFTSIYAHAQSALSVCACDRRRSTVS